MKYTFGDIVVIKGSLVGVIVKTWINQHSQVTHDVYVRMSNKILPYAENEIERYMVRHKYLNEEEQEYQYNAINNL